MALLAGLEAALPTPRPKRSAAHTACRYRRALLEELGVGHLPVVERDAPIAHPDLQWARSGAMALSGQAAGAPLLVPAPLAACAHGALAALRSLAPRPLPTDLDAAELLGERAALLGLRRRGRTAPGGSCRLLRSADGWLAVNLAREDDHGLIPAWLEAKPDQDPWPVVARRVRVENTRRLVERARLLGLPVAPVVRPARRSPAWLRIASCGPRRPPEPLARPLVVDLSSLWAGPLCGHLLQLAGAQVIKLESLRRPDGARRGNADFYALLNAGKASVALDFSAHSDRARLRQLLSKADIVVESSRPRALAQLGIDAEALVAETPGLTWLSITGYGRREPAAHWVAFGDDASAAAGLTALTGGGRSPLFCGDAIADPLTGLHGAVAALACWRRGGGALLDLALCDVVAHVLAFERGDASAEQTTRLTLRPAERDAMGASWIVDVNGRRELVRAPRARPSPGGARPLGADTSRTLHELDVRC